jgi:hypothetical protein
MITQSNNTSVKLEPKEEEYERLINLIALGPPMLKVSDGFNAQFRNKLMTKKSRPPQKLEPEEDAHYFRIKMIGFGPPIRVSDDFDEKFRQRLSQRTSNRDGGTRPKPKLRRTRT